MSRVEVRDYGQAFPVIPAAVLALLASLAYGSSDFVAGLSSRRVSSVAVALWSQLAGAVALVAALAASGQPLDVSGILWGAVSGIVAALGVLVFYRALAIGPASVVSPVAAGGVAIPILVGVLGGSPPSTAATAGLLAAIGGLALVSLTSGEDPGDVAEPCPGRKPLPERNIVPGSNSDARRVVPLALLAALCFGSFFVLLDRGTAGAENSVLWVALGVDVGSLPTTVAVVMFYRRGSGLRLPPVRLLLPIALVGLLAVGGDVALAYATTAGALSVVSVLASLDILVTVVLARFVLSERLPRLQSIGVGLSVVGVLLISSG